MRNSKCKVTTTRDSVLIEWKDGVTSSADIDDMEASMIRQLAIHGLKQKLVDSHASLPQISVARAAAEATFAHLQKGEWTAKGGRSTKLAEAVAHMQGLEVTDVIIALGKLTKDQRKAVAADPRVKLAIAELDAEKQRELVELQESDDSDIFELLNLEEETPEE